MVRRPSGQSWSPSARCMSTKSSTSSAPSADNGILEDYSAQVHGEPISCVVLVTRNAAGQTQHIVANYRPRSSLLLLSRLVGEKLAETPYGEHFAATES